MGDLKRDTQKNEVFDSVKSIKRSGICEKKYMTRPKKKLRFNLLLI